MPEAFIVGAVRTAGGRKNGKLKNWHPIDLGAFVLDELVARTGADPAAIEDVIFGCVDQVGARAWQTYQRQDGSVVYGGRRLGRAPGRSGDGWTSRSFAVWRSGR